MFDKAKLILTIVTIGLVFSSSALLGVADTVPPLAPTAVGGKEYSNAPDEDAGGTANHHQIIGWDGLGGAANTRDFSPNLHAGLQETQVDAMAMLLDNLYMEVSHQDSVTMLASFTGSPDIYHTAPIAHAPVHGAPPKVGVWTAAATINQASRPDDVDGLEIFGPAAPSSGCQCGPGRAARTSPPRSSMPPTSPRRSGCPKI